MDYSNVKSSFSLYDEENADYGYYEGKKPVIKQEETEESKLFSILNVILYIIMFLFATVGIITLVFPSTREALFSLLF